MPSPFSFFKNLTNHSSHNSSQNPPSREHAPYKGKRKLRKTSVHQSPRNSNSHEDAPLHVPHMKVPQMQDRPAEERPYHAIPVHPSIPDGSVDGWRAFPPPYRANTMHMLIHGKPPPRESADSVPPENPMVSRYYSGDPAILHPQPQHPQQLPPSRSWSPIPSVHRESFSQGGHEGNTTKDESWGENLTPISPQGHSTPLKQLEDSRHSTVLTIGQQPSEHELRYIELPAVPIEKQPDLVYPAAHSQSGSHGRRQAPTEAMEPEIMERNESWGSNAEAESEPEVYHYIVPAGLNVVFQDEDGTEITRVGKTVKILHGGRPLKSVPIIVHDELGKELYRDPLPAGNVTKRSRSRQGLLASGYKPKETDVHHSTARGDPHPPWSSIPPGSNTSSRSTKTIMIDERGNQIPV